MPSSHPEHTPIEVHNGIYLKRDDLFEIAGVYGGKVRACWELATRTTERRGLLECELPPALGLITASARKSPQAKIVARIAHKLGIPARCHMPQGAMTDEMVDVFACGGEIVQHKAGYNNVITSRAKDDVAGHPGWRYVPFGMESSLAVTCTRQQVADIPSKAARIVVCVGSGMSAAGVLHGLQDIGASTPVLGVCVGADPTRRLDKFAPSKWRTAMELVNVVDTIPYHIAVIASVGGVGLDPYYEAKCAKYLRPGDLFWIVGNRNTPGSLSPCA